MARRRLLTEFGLGTSLRRADYTKAAREALKDALWRHSINLAEAFAFDRSAMVIEAEVAVQCPDAVDAAALAEVFPYGDVSVRVMHGGLDVPRADGSLTVIANAAISVSFDMARA
jgi:uncharacterized protein (TIGR02058 family)